jgi:hypothetical protein
MGGVVIDGLRDSLAKKLAGSRISDERVNELAKGVFLEGAKHVRLDICAYGICIDYLVDRPRFFDALITIKGLRRVEVFPYGIPVPDIYRAHLEIEVPELTAQQRV